MASIAGICSSGLIFKGQDSGRRNGVSFFQYSGLRTTIDGTQLDSSSRQNGFNFKSGLISIVLSILLSGKFFVFHVCLLIRSNFKEILRMS